MAAYGSSAAQFFRFCELWPPCLPALKPPAICRPGETILPNALSGAYSSVSLSIQQADACHQGLLFASGSQVASPLILWLSTCFMFVALLT